MPKSAFEMAMISPYVPYWIYTKSADVFSAVANFPDWVSAVNEYVNTYDKLSAQIKSMEDDFHGRICLGKRDPSRLNPILAKNNYWKLKRDIEEKKTEMGKMLKNLLSKIQITAEEIKNTAYCCEGMRNREKFHNKHCNFRPIIIFKENMNYRYPRVPENIREYMEIPIVEYEDMEYRTYEDACYDSGMQNMQLNLGEENFTEEALPENATQMVQRHINQRRPEISRIYDPQTNPECNLVNMTPEPIAVEYDTKENLASESAEPAHTQESKVEPTVLESNIMYEETAGQKITQSEISNCEAIAESEARVECEATVECNDCEAREAVAEIEDCVAVVSNNDSITRERITYLNLTGEDISVIIKRKNGDRDLEHYPSAGKIAEHLLTGTVQTKYDPEVGMKVISREKKSIKYILDMMGLAKLCNAETVAFIVEQGIASKIEWGGLVARVWVFAPGKEIKGGDVICGHQMFDSFILLNKV